MTTKTRAEGKQMSTIWIVSGRSGEYSDRCEWPAFWCATEAEANVLRDKLQAENDGVLGEDRYDAPKARERMTDKQWQTDYTGTTYSVYSLERAP